MMARALCALLVALACSCATRSISNTTMPYPGQNALYRGELSEFDVLGVGASWMQSYMQDKMMQTPVQLPQGARVLLVQSGSMLPDAGLEAAMRERYSVTSASGIPAGWAEAGDGLRGVALRGGFDAVVACWGALESSSGEVSATAWIPVVGLFLPAEDLHMRLRLRFVCMDVRTGRWTAHCSTPVVSMRTSSLATRVRVDAEQVQELKEQGYPAAVREFAEALAPR